MDTNRFTQKSLEALQAAQQLAQSYGNAQVEQVHLLDALLSQENGLIGQLMGKLGLNVQQVRTACESAVNRLPKISGSNQQPYVTASLSQALTEAENQMKQMRDEYISVEHLFLGLLEKADSTVRPLFASLDITKPKFLEALQAVRGSARVTSEDPESTYDALKKYGQDLVELARQNKLDPVIGRDTEIRNAIRILSRKSKNNPVLIGTGCKTLLSASSQMPLCSSALAGFGAGFGASAFWGAGLAGANVPKSTVAAISSSENSASFR